jgi:thiol-disulfide isomerase/thioredoxin
MSFVPGRSTGSLAVMWQSSASIAAICFLASTIANAQVGDSLNGAQIGTTLPPHELKYVQGSDGTPRQLTLLDFWATWCAPCLESIPKLDHIASAFRDKHVHVVGVTREEEALVLPFLAKHPMKYAVALDRDGRLYKALNIQALPYAIVVNGAGTVIWRGQPEKIDDALMHRLLANE